MVKDVKTLSPQEHVLLRPEGYLGSLKPENSLTARGYNGKKMVEVQGWIPGSVRALQEVLDNSVDAAIRDKFKSGKNISLCFHDDYYIVQDDGHGLPIKFSDKDQAWQPELAFSRSMAGSNFEGERSTAGLFGIGVFVTNVMSTRLELTTSNGKEQYTQVFEHNCSVIHPPSITKGQFKQGTTVKVYPDKTRLPWGVKDVLVALQMLNNLMFCYPEITIKAAIHENPVDLLSPQDLIEATVVDQVGDWSNGGGRVVLGLQSSFIGWVNGTECKGIHIATFQSLVSSRVIESINIEGLTRADVSRNIGGLLSVRVVNPAFNSATKTEIVDCDRSALDEVLSDLADKVSTALLSHEPFLSRMEEIVKSRGNKKLRSAEKKAQQKVDKLIDACAKTPAERWLFITEGDSARGQFAAARDSQTQAIYCLRGKIMNATSDDDPSQLLKSRALIELSAVLGLSMTSKDISSRRYDHICIATDADHDGSSICGLMLGFIYRFWPDLLRRGLVYRLLTPRYVLGKERTFVYNDRDLPKGYKGEVRYIKGLGSLALQDVELILQNPLLERMMIDDTTHQVIDLVFGEDINARKLWLSNPPETSVHV